MHQESSDDNPTQSSSLSSDLLGTVVRPPSIRVLPGSYQSTLSGRLTPRSSPSFRRSPSVRTPSSSSSSPSPARDSRFTASLPPPWYKKFFIRNRLFQWLLVFVLWAYMAFLLQSRWTEHTDDEHRNSSLNSQYSAEDWENGNRVIFEDLEGEEKNSLRNVFDTDQDTSSLMVDEGHSYTDSGLIKPPLIVKQQMSEQRFEPSHDNPSKTSCKESLCELLVQKTSKMSSNVSWYFPSIGEVNGSMGSLVGPFDETERLILGSEIEWTKKLRFCSNNSTFARAVYGKSFLLVFHELSMTGSPLAMMELANEILKCGGKVSVVALSQKGGLLQEILAKGIRVLKSKGHLTFKFAAKVDLLISGSAVCASWIADIMQKKGTRRLVWWIMENRREYFDRSKHILHFAKALIFLSDSQLKRWKVWSEAEHIILPDMIKVISLSVNEDLAVKSGLRQELSVIEKRRDLRNHVRAEMGLSPHDILFTTLSSINPGKGQLKLLQAVAMAVEGFDEHVESNILSINNTISDTRDIQNSMNQGRMRLLIGSVGSKSNKVDYVSKMMEFISDHPCLTDVILWTPTTVQVASLYAASDVYVMNSQGIGETFGRVTIEAMAFSLPILGTNAGGTPEIVDDDVEGMLHPVGVDGIPVLAQHINIMMRNATLRKKMGLNASQKVQKYYMKEKMYENLSNVFSG